VDDREEVVTSEGFDWLYGEDAAGAVVQEPPAIGAVTERNPVAPPVATIEARAEVVDPNYDEDPFGNGLPAPEAIAAPVEDFDPAELDASFGPPAPVATPAVDETQQSTAPAPPSGERAMVPPPPPPPPPPAAAPATVPENDQAPGETEPTAEVPEVQAAVEERTVAETYGFDPNSSETTVMSAVSNGNTAQIPVASSRGDIIAAGPRKMSVLERLTPTARAPKVERSRDRSSEASKGAKVVVGILVTVMSLCLTAWRFEGLREIVLGNGAPSEEQVDAAFTPLKGYPYSEVPQDVMDMTRETTDSLMPREVEHYDLRLIGQPANPAGMVMIFSIDPDLATPEQWDREMQMAPPTNVGAIKEIKVAGVDAISASPPDAQGAGFVMFADPEGLVFLAVGNTAAVAEDVAKQLAKANI
jgi:hypothetical protein